VETLNVFAHSIIAGTGFTISAFNTSQLNEPLEAFFRPGLLNTTKPVDMRQWPTKGGAGTRIYGQWTIAWAWN